MTGHPALVDEIPVDPAVDEAAAGGALASRVTERRRRARSRRPRAGVFLARRIVVVVVVASAVGVLLLHAKRSTSALSIAVRADGIWLGVVAGAALATFLMAAVSTMGSTTVALRLPITFAMQLASSLANRFVPGGIAGAVVNVRYVERAGAPRTDAGAANVLNNACGLVVHVALFVALLPFFGGLHRDIDPPDDSGWMLAVLATLVTTGIVIWVRWIPTHWKQPVVATRRAARQVVTRPGRVARLLGGSTGVTVALSSGSGLRCTRCTRRSGSPTWRSCTW